MRHKCNVKYKFGINYSLHWTDQMLLMLDRIPSMSSSICLSFVFSDSTWAWKTSPVLNSNIPYGQQSAKPPSSMSGEYIYSGGFWDSKACAVCARWDRSGAAAPNSAPKIVWQFLEPSLVLLQQSTDQSEKSCEDNLPVSSNISKPNSAPKRCDRIGSASVATWASIVRI